MVMLILWHLLCEGDRKNDTKDINHTKSVKMDGYSQQFHHQAEVHNQEKREMLYSMIPSLLTNLIRCKLLNTGVKEDKGSIFSLRNKDVYELDYAHFFKFLFCQINI